MSDECVKKDEEHIKKSYYLTSIGLSHRSIVGRIIRTLCICQLLFFFAWKWVLLSLDLHNCSFSLNTSLIFEIKNLAIEKTITMHAAIKMRNCLENFELVYYYNFWNKKTRLMGLSLDDAWGGLLFLLSLFISFHFFFNYIKGEKG